MIICAIDPGTSAAYACSNGTFGRWDFSRMKGSPAGLPLVMFYRRLTLFCSQNEVDVLAYEKLLGGKKQFGRDLQYGWQSVMLMVAAELGMELKAYFPSNLKKRVTGSGKADKDQMRRQFIQDHGLLIASHGIDVNDHDLVDALWILYLARQDCQ